MKAHTIFLTALALSTPAAFSESDSAHTPPPPGEPRTIKLPEPVEKTLANGLRVIAVERPALPILSVQLVIKSGGEVDPQNAAGAMEMTAALLMRGAGKRSAPQLAQAIEALGGTIETGAGWDATTASLTIMSAQAAAGLEILSDVVRRPVFATAEIERLRAETLDELRVKMEEPGSVAKAVAARVIFGDGPYAHMLSGTPNSVAHITRAQLTKLHATYFRPDNAVLIFAGSATSAEAFAWAEKFFGDWKNPNTTLPATHAIEPLSKPRVVVIDMPNAGQAAVVVGKTTIARKAADYYPGVVASAVLGGGYSARMNTEIRVKRGLTYGASSELAARNLGGAFTALAQTKNSAGPEVATLMMAEMDRLAATPVPADELTPRTSTLTGEYGRSLETNDGFASRLATWAVEGVPLSMLNSYIAEILAVQPADVQKFADERLKSAETSVVIAGHTESFRAALDERFKDAVIIPQKELDLDASDLRQPPKDGKTRKSGATK